MRKPLAIFDLDGTLFDTVPVNFMAYRDALEPEGFTLDRDYFAKYCNGGYYKDFIPKITGSSDEAMLARIHQRKKAAYSTYVRQAVPNTHLFRLAQLAADAYNLALVTTASRKNTQELLEAFGVQDLFALILTQEDVIRKKPDPEGFLLAMAHFDASPADTVIFEDSPAGLEAAQRSGAAVFSIVSFGTK